MKLFAVLLGSLLFFNLFLSLVFAASPLTNVNTSTASATLNQDDPNTSAGETIDSIKNFLTGLDNFIGGFVFSPNTNLS